MNGNSKARQEQGKRRNQRSLALQNANQAQQREIGDIPPVVKPQRKRKCKKDFGQFCKTYFPQVFSLPFSDDHKKIISRIETCVLYGGLFALAMPRGTGKTTMCECAVLWSLLYGHREFVVLIGQTETAQSEMIDSIKTEIEVNDLLFEDFPEQCYPVRCLEGITLRAKGQTCNGERTNIGWAHNDMILPTIKGKQCSGCCVRVAGITGRIRGMKYKRSDGKSVRPSLVIIDDPQTRESAESIEQNRKRISILNGDILGLAGAGNKISGIMPCTIISPGDMADQMLDKKKHPDWNGEKCKMMYSFPTNQTLWEEYASIRADSLREHGDISDQTRFYMEHREDMDAGAEPAWKERFNRDEISAVQNAMNLKLRDEFSFMAEYQNEPLQTNTAEEKTLTAEELSLKLNGIDRYTVPLTAEYITMMIDVQKTALFYCVCAFSDDFTGAVIDYGTYPEQPQRNLPMIRFVRTIQDKYPGNSIEAQIYSQAFDFLSMAKEKEYVRQDGLRMRIDQIMIDANWGTTSESVYSACQSSGATVLPSHGKYIGASSIPMTAYKRKMGEKLGYNWVISKSQKNSIRHIVFDSNYWKSFVHSRFTVSMGDKSGMTLYGKKPFEHEQFCNNLVAEYRTKTAGNGRICDEWKLRPNSPDNHYLDCIAGCCVQQSTLGCQLPEHHDFQALQRKSHVSLSARTVQPVEQKKENEPVNQRQPKKRISLQEYAKNRRW